MNEHRYILEPYQGMNSRYICPACNSKNKTFVRYIDSVTGEYLHPSVGRCNREINCGYHYTPRQFFQENHIFNEQTVTAVSKKIMTKEEVKINDTASFIPNEHFKESLQIGKNVFELAQTNNFIQFLCDKFGVDSTRELIGKYFISTSDYWTGATLFWQVDLKGKIRAGKIMLYDLVTGKRVKEPYSHINWFHKVRKFDDFKLRQCFFGEHLLRDNIQPVAVVESEKTAIIASVYLPEFVWLAAGSKNGLNKEKCQVLRGRNIVLFPDLNCHQDWKIKAKELSHLACFIVSDLLQNKSSEAEKNLGLDISDFLLNFDRKFFNDRKKIASINRSSRIFRGINDTKYQQNLNLVRSQINHEKYDLRFMDYFFEERAAIMEYDGCMTREEAENWILKNHPEAEFEYVISKN